MKFSIFVNPQFKIKSHIPHFLLIFRDHILSLYNVGPKKSFSSLTRPFSGVCIKQKTKTQKQKAKETKENRKTK